MFKNWMANEEIKSDATRFTLTQKLPNRLSHLCKATGNHYAKNT